MKKDIVSAETPLQTVQNIKDTMMMSGVANVSYFIKSAAITHGDM